MVIEMNPTVEGNEGSTKLGQDGDKAELRAIDDLAFPQVDLIKIDVEGFELEVLAGATQTLRRDQPLIVMEVHGDGGDQAVQAHFDSVMALIAQLGYQAQHVRGANYVFTPGPTS